MERVEPPDLPRREPYGTLLGSSIVFAVITLLVGTLVVVDDSVSGAEEIPPGTVLDVGGGVAFVPAAGWFLVPEQVVPGSRTVVASRGSSFRVEGKEWDGTLAAEVERTRRTVEAGDARITGDGESFHSAGGLTGTRLAFVTTSGQGRAWVALDEPTRRSVIVIAVSPAEVYRQVAPEVDEMLDSVRLAGVGG
ncbi:MAG: hypothetical protein HOV94_21030 [Saccharothrix sp.]|nr:hypothetical protein [Saccharothrix sp.]